MLRNSIGLALALGLAGGCAFEEDSVEESTTEAALTDGSTAVDSFTLHVSASPFGTMAVSNPGPDGPISHSCKTCDLPYLDGTRLTIRVINPINRIDCMQFGNWVQAPCNSSHTSTCTTTIHSNITATVKWIPLLGCRPQ